MEEMIRRLRRKYVITAFFIAFSIITVMIVVLNLLMQMTYRNERNTAADIITQTAISHADNLYTEYYLLEETE